MLIGLFISRLIMIMLLLGLQDPHLGLSVLVHLVVLGAAVGEVDGSLSVSDGYGGHGVDADE